MEGQVSYLEDQMPPLARDVRMAAQQVIQAKYKIDDMENRLRLNNIQIVGLPETVEGRDPTAFIEGWLQEVFDKKAFTPL